MAVVVAVQSLWDLNAATVEESLGDDMRRWQRLLTDITRARATFDTSVSSRRFGPITVQFEQARGSLC